MNYIFTTTSFVALLLGMSFGSCKPAAETQNELTYSNISAQEAMSMMADNNEIKVLDVRTPEEVAEGKIANALEIDYRGENFEEKIKALNKSDSYIVYCRSGKRSAESSTIMAKLGFKKVHNMEGGILAWEEINK